jgi:hypothetical protein
MNYEKVFKALNKARVKYVIAGGVAVVLHGFMRLTNDLDLIVLLDAKLRSIECPGTRDCH